MNLKLAGTYFTLFYTKYLGVDSLIFAAILVILRIWDAINDPIMGGLIDNSDPNKSGVYGGKFKRFIFIGSIGLIFSGALSFLPIPNASLWVKVTLCILTYLIWDISYTLANVPYGAIAAYISADPVERSQLSMWRLIGSGAASLPISTFLPFLIYDESDNLIGARLFWIALVLGIVGFFAFQLLIRGTVERVDQTDKMQTGEGQESGPARGKSSSKLNYVDALKKFFSNRGAMGVTFAAVAYFLGIYGGATTTAVVFQSYFEMADISGIVGLVSYIPLLLMMPFIPKIVKKKGKKKTAEIGLAIGTVGGILMVVLPIPPNMTGIVILILCNFLIAIGVAFFMNVSYAMVSDSIDYTLWKTGEQRGGTIYSMHVFFRKATTGIGPSLVLILMVWLGYDESLGAAQTAETAFNMRYLMAGLNLFTVLVAYLCIKYIYNLDLETIAKMEADLGREVDV